MVFGSGPSISYAGQHLDTDIALLMLTCVKMVPSSVIMASSRACFGYIMK